MQFRDLITLYLIFLTIFWCKTDLVEGIFGGLDPVGTEYRYTVSVQGNKVHIGNGAILNPKHVITAAKYFLNLDNKFLNVSYRVVAGFLNLSNPAVIKIPVEKIYLPKDFKIFESTNKLIPEIVEEGPDIAILKLQKPFVLTKGPLKTVHLPDDKSEIHDLVVSGYGTTTPYIADMNANEYTNWKIISNIEPCKHCLNLKYAYIMPTKHSNECPNHLKIQDYHICARVKNLRGELVGVCKGDVGSPLVTKENIIIGVYSDGPHDCDERKELGVYTSVKHNLGWIADAMNDRLSNKQIRIATYILKKNIFSKDELYLKENN